MEKDQLIEKEKLSKFMKKANESEKEAYRKFLKEANFQSFQKLLEKVNEQA